MADLGRGDLHRPDRAGAGQAALASGARLIVTHHPCIFPEESRGLSRLVPGRGPGAGVDRAEAYRAGRRGRGLPHELRPVRARGRRAPSRAGSGPSQRAASSKTTGRAAAQASDLRAVRATPRRCGRPSATPAPARSAITTLLVQRQRGRELSVAAETRGLFSASRASWSGREELRLETIYPVGLEPPSSRSIDSTSHPYEEVAYDIYSVEQRSASGKKGLVRGFGYGFWGDLKAPRAFPEMTKDVKSLFNLDGFLLTEKGRENSRNGIRTHRFRRRQGLRVCLGGIEAGCDLFITGEVGYHGALEASRRGMTVMEIGHRESERFFVETMKAWISDLKLRAVPVDVPTQRFSAAH